MKIASQAQAGLLGAAASGAPTDGGPPPAKARQMLRENAPFNMRDLPVRAVARPSIRKVSYRGGR